MSLHTYWVCAYPDIIEVIQGNQQLLSYQTSEDEGQTIRQYFKMQTSPESPKEQYETSPYKSVEEWNSGCF